MAKRRPNISPRTRPAQALKGLPPRMTEGEPDFINAPEPELTEAQEASSEAARGRKPTLTAAEAAYVEGTAAFEEEKLAEQTEPEPVLGEIMSPRALAPPVIPEGLMSDDPFPGQTPDDGDRYVPTQPRPEQPIQAAMARTVPSVPGRPAAGRDHAAGAHGAALTDPVRADPSFVTDPRSAVLTHAGVGDPFVSLGEAASGVIEYVQRVTIASAYQFNGRVQTAPDWIDRNWLSFDEASKEETGIGIVLDVPGIGVCRIGDYIVRQEVLLDEHGTRVARVAVYPREDFEKLFLPVSRA